jgi:hypothetical protein
MELLLLLLLMLYFALVISELEYVSAAWNFVTTTDSNKLWRTQRKFAAHCHNRFFKMCNIITIIYWKD